MITTSDVEYFLALESHRSFTSAARALDISQPALTMAISKLEAKTGFPLFVRDRSGVRLTAAGQALLPAVRRARDASRGVVEAAALIERAQLGTLRIGCRPMLARDPVAHLVGAFSGEHPGVSIEIESVGKGVTPIDVLRGGLADVIVTTDDDQIDGLAVTEIGQIEIVAMLRDHPQLGDYASIADILQIGLVGMSGYGVVDRAVAEFVDRRQLAEATRIRSYYSGIVESLAVRGVGAMFVPERVAQSFARQGARVVRLLEQPTISIVIAYMARNRSPVVTQFIELSMGKFGAQDESRCHK